MVAEVPYSSERLQVPHPSEAEVATTIKITQKTDIEVPTMHTTIQAPATDDMEITSLVDTQVTASGSIDPSIDIDGGFSGGSNDF